MHRSLCIPLPVSAVIRLYNRRMHRLVAYAHGGVHRFVVNQPQMVLGSATSCDIHLPFAGVGPSHARISTEGAVLTIEDLGSRKGVLVNGKRTREVTTLNVLDEIRLGQVALLVEDVAPAPPEAVTSSFTPKSPAVTITPEGFLEHLAGVSRWVQSDSASSRTLESLLNAMLEDFGGGVIFLFQGEEEAPSIKFVVASEAVWLTAGEAVLSRIQEAEAETEDRQRSGAQVADIDGRRTWIAHHILHAHERAYRFVVALPQFENESWSPQAGFRTLGDLLVLGLVHHVGQFQPIVFNQPEQPDLTLAPGLVVGESPAMKKVLEQLRAAVDPPVNVLLRGETGVSKELLARSLHLSGPRRDGPFVVFRSAGASEQQLEADLFGAEVRGRSGDLEREGKLLEADGGTLLIDEVDTLPITIQSRLVRFIRSGEIAPTSGGSPKAVDVRLIVSSTGPLEALVTRDQFRVDLAYLLARLTVDVPALRDRREDLPLLIQVTINRCCHQMAKRVQGIAVKALESLVRYPYPGNLPELENIVRRLVFLCPQGRPIDASMLPEAVRLGTIKGLVPETRGDLDLERLVADCERAAIREALRRTSGNKSGAARQLGLSRNGLAMKMQRLGLAEAAAVAKR